MKELDIRFKDTLYWGEQEWECIQVDTADEGFPFCLEYKKAKKAHWFTKFGQTEEHQPQVLSFTPYSIEKGGATFERPKEPLRPIDITTLQKVRFKDLAKADWDYGYFIAEGKISAYPFACISVSGFFNTWQRCEPYEWTDNEKK